MAGWVPDAPGTGGCSYTGVTAPLFAPPGVVPWRRHLHGYAAGWTRTGHLLHQELTRTRPRCCRMGTSLPRYLSLPTATAPWAKSGIRQPQGSAWQGWGYPACHCQGTQQPLPCVLPHASCQHPARATGLCHLPRDVPCPRAVSGPGSPLWHTGSYLCPWEPRVLGRWLVARVGCGVRGPLGSGWARAGLSCCSWRRAAGACLLLRQPCQARGGTCPHRALAKVRHRKVHTGSGPRVTQQCPVPRLAGRRHSIPTGLLCPVVQHMGPLRQAGNLAGTRSALHGPVCASLGHTCSSSTESPAQHYPSTHVRWILFTPSAGTVGTTMPHSPCAGRCCLGSSGLARLGAELAALEPCREHVCAPGPGSTETSLSHRDSAFYEPRLKEGRGAVCSPCQGHALAARHQARSWADKKAALGHRDAKTHSPRDTLRQPGTSAVQEMLWAVPYQLPIAMQGT